jgi:dUTP pyrophosphatase
MKVEILETESIKEFGVPKYADLGSSGVDLRASEDAIINPGERRLIHTGVKIALPKEVYIEQTDSFISFEAQVRSRSGLALKNGVFVLNGVGTIDESYRGECGVILYNSNNEVFTIKKGDRIAQLVLCPIMKFDFKIVKSLDETDRVGGFGSTGIK